MSDIPLLISYVLAAWLSILTPGPAILLAMRNGARQGVVASLWSTLGNIIAGREGYEITEGTVSLHRPRFSGSALSDTKARYLP